jgi:hypothetical protein
MNLTVKEPNTMLADNEKLSVFKKIVDGFKIFDFFMILVRRKFIEEQIVRREITVSMLGNVGPLSSFYLYFSALYFNVQGVRTIEIGVINWLHGIHTLVRVNFRVYPERSIYLPGQRHCWLKPSHDTSVLAETQYDQTGDFSEEEAKDFINIAVRGAAQVVCLYHYETVESIIRKCAQKRSVQLSWRLTQILKGYLYIACRCGAYRDFFQEKHCCCWDENVRDRYPDAGLICDDEVFFTPSNC